MSASEQVARVRPPKIVTPSLDKELVRLGIKQYYQQLLPGRDASDKMINLEAYDPTPHRSIDVPVDSSTVKLPIAICYKTWWLPKASQQWQVRELYKWVECTFEQLRTLTERVVPSECNLFAVILSSYPLHTFFDLDGKADMWAHLQGREEEVMAAMMYWYVRFFELTVGRAPDVSRVYWEKSCSKAKPVSLHMHNLGEVFRSKRDHLEFVLRFRDYLNEQEDCILVHPTTDLDKDANERCLIDKVVYSHNRNMRLVYSCKPGGVNLMPVNSEVAPVANAAEALWASLPSYSMPTDESTYFAFPTYTRTNDESKEVVLPLPSPKTCTSTAVDTKTIDTFMNAADTHGHEGTDGDRRRQNTRFALLPEQIKQVVLKLDVDKRIQGERNEWRRLVWATKAAWPEEQWSEGLAFMHEIAKRCKPNSMRPSRLEWLWRDGHKDAYNAGTLYKMLKQDVSAAEYRKLYRQHHPHHASGSTTDVNDDTSNAVVVDDLIAKFRTDFLDNNEMAGVHQLPHIALLQWNSDNLNEDTLKRITHSEKMRLLESAILPFCNRYWKFIFSEKSYMLVKQSRDQPHDDRKFLWLCMTERGFVGAAHSDFQLRWAHTPKENMAHVWLRWCGRECYNGIACVPPTARPEQMPPSFLFNTWVGLRISHERARRDGDPNHQDWIDFKDYLWRAFLSGEPDEIVKNFFLLWYVSQYVRPGWKLKVAMALYSLLRQVGKSQLAKIMRKLLLGDTLVVECKSKDALGEFNGPLDAMLLVCLEEFARNAEYNDNLKIELTSDVRTVNKKSINQFTQPNCTNWMIPTNHPDAIDVVDFDKRVITFLIEDGINTKLVEDDGVLKDYSLYKDREWNDVHIAAGMLAWAEEMKLDEWDSTNLPVTEGSKLQRRCGEETHHPVVAWWRSVVEDDNKSKDVLWDGWNPTSLLFALFVKQYEDDTRVRTRYPMNKFTQEFAKRGYQKASRRRSPAIDELCTKHRVYFKEDQEKVSAFKLPDRKKAIEDLDKPTRPAKLEAGEDEE